MSVASWITGKTTIWSIPDARASDEAIVPSNLRCSLIAGMPVAQAVTNCLPGGKFGQDDGMAGGPGLAGQAFVIGEQRVLADRLEFGILGAAKAAAEFKFRSGPVRHP